MIKTKIREYKDSIITSFHDKKIPKEEMPCKCLSIIMLDSVLYAYEQYHPQTFLEECKYEKEKIKAKNYIDQELKSDSDPSDETESDTGTNTDTNDNK